MPNCHHRTAECVVGDFWVCKVQGCSNGPPKPTPTELSSEWTRYGFMISPDWDQGVVAPLVAARLDVIFAYATRVPTGWVVKRAEGFELCRGPACPISNELSVGPAGEPFYWREVPTATRPPNNRYTFYYSVP